MLKRKTPTSAQSGGDRVLPSQKPGKKIRLIQDGTEDDSPLKLTPIPAAAAPRATAAATTTPTAAAAAGKKSSLGKESPITSAQSKPKEEQLSKKKDKRHKKGEQSNGEEETGDEAAKKNKKKNGESEDDVLEKVKLLEKEIHASKAKLNNVVPLLEYCQVRPPCHPLKLLKPLVAPLLIFCFFLCL